MLNYDCVEFLFSTVLSIYEITDLKLENYHNAYGMFFYMGLNLL